MQARAIPGFAQAEWITAEEAADTTPLSELSAATPGHAFEAAFAALGPETVGKILSRRDRPALPRE